MERNYIAFISYRHKPLDAKAARMIEKRIESYRIPKELRKTPDSDAVFSLLFLPIIKK